MSMKTYINYGYGICVENLEVDSTDSIEKLISLAPLYQKRIYDSFKESDITDPTVDDYLEYTDDDGNGFADLLAEVMREATGIWFDACSDYNGNSYLLYMPTYPWQMSRNDVDITEADIGKLIREHVAVISNTEIELGYQEVENCG